MMTRLITATIDSRAPIKLPLVLKTNSTDVSLWWLGKIGSYSRLFRSWQLDHPLSPASRHCMMEVIMTSLSSVIVTSPRYEYCWTWSPSNLAACASQVLLGSDPARLDRHLPGSCRSVSVLKRNSMTDSWFSVMSVSCQICLCVKVLLFGNHLLLTGQSNLAWESRMLVQRSNRYCWTEE